MPKRKCKFSDTYTQEWSIIKKGRYEQEAHCSICDVYLSIGHGGKSDISDHINSAKHKSKIGAASTSRDLTTFFIKQNSKQEELICLAFFEAEENAPKAIIDFFKEPLSQIYMLFMHCQGLLIEKHIRCIEKKDLSVVEVLKHLNETINTLKERMNHKFIGSVTLYRLDELKNEKISCTQFENDTDLFFKTVIKYIEQWSQPLEKYKLFNWMMLSDIPCWEDVNKVIIYLKELQIDLTDSTFEEFIYLKSFMELQNEDFYNKTMIEKWTFYFNNTKEKERKQNLIKIVQYLSAIPGHNANVERIFSLVSSQWTKERNSLKIKTIESIIQCKFNLNMTCNEFYNYIKEQKNVIEKTKKSSKYN